jgi:hypothetical protein
MLPRDSFDALLRRGTAAIRINTPAASVSIASHNGLVSMDMGPERSVEGMEAGAALGRLNAFLGNLGFTGLGFDRLETYDVGTVVRMMTDDGAMIVSTILEKDGSTITARNALVEVVEVRKARLFEFDIATQGAMLERFEVPYEQLSLEWLGRLAWSEMPLKGRRRQPREIFVERYGEDALARVGAAIEAESDWATNAIIRHMRGETDPTGMEAAAADTAARDAALEAWSSIAEERTPGGCQPVRDPGARANPLEYERAVAAVPDNAIWAASGELDGNPWRAELYRGQYDGWPVVRIELDRAGSTEWSMFNLRVDLPDISDARLREQAPDRYPRRHVCVRGDVTLSLYEKHVTYGKWDGDEDIVRDRGGPELGHSSVLKVVCERILADRTPFLVEHLLGTHRAHTASVIKNWATASGELETAEEDVAVLRLELDRLIATLPERDRRRLSDMTVDELTANPEYLRDTPLGVLRMLPRHDGSGIDIEPTGRRCKVTVHGRLLDNRDYYTSVDRDGTLTDARFAACSPVVGARLLIEAVKSFIGARPEAFTRAEIAEVARRTAAKLVVLDAARTTYEATEEEARVQGEDHVAVLAFAQHRPEAVGIAWPPYPSFDDPETIPEAEVPRTVGPSPLW